MFGSTIETVCILGGVVLILAVIVSLFINPAITVVVFTVLAWINLGIIILICEPFGSRSSR